MMMTSEIIIKEEMIMIVKDIDLNLVNIKMNIRIEMITTTIQINLKTNTIIELNSKEALNLKIYHKKIEINKMMITSTKEVVETIITQIMMNLIVQNRPEIRIERITRTKIKIKLIKRLIVKIYKINKIKPKSHKKMINPSYHQNNNQNKILLKKKNKLII